MLSKSAFTRISLCLLMALTSIIVAPKANAQGKKQTKAAKPDKAAPAATPVAATETAAAEKKEGDPVFKGMKFRSIGPFRGGRSLTAAGIAGDPTTYYFGGTGGGVWKSVDGALTWTPVFDHQGTSSIGSIAVAPSDRNVVYVGTGEACIRGNISDGDGVYKSLDGGKTWKNMGLKDTRAIGRVIVNPRNSDIAFVAALGHPFGPNSERGVFRTTDGGKTWEKVLYQDENTGAIDIAFDPANPNVLFASLWQARRTPWTLSSGGPGSGIYRSGDGGSTWKKLTEHGLPKGPWGRIGIAVAANSDRVYALIQAEEGGLYRSDDGGESWQLINPDHSLRQRPWYYMHVIADPQDADLLYIMNVDAFKSTDGGHSFNKVKVPHGDNHGLWIDPRNTKRMALSNDGGVSVSTDGGKSWTQQDNQPTAQFYHVITDTRTPYFVYGAQQDNSTVAIASRSDDGTIGRPDWYPVGGGEAGYIAPYPPDPNIVYAGDYEGNLTRFDKRTGQVQNIAVSPVLTDAKGAATLEHRFQWTAPLITSPHDPSVLYYGGERLFKTSDGGVKWEAVSPDLTRNDKSKQIASGGPITIDDTGTEYYDTIFSIAESPLEKGVIWVGTDDGLVQITRDGGQHWTNITPRDMPEWSRISQIDVSPQDKGAAYVAADRHQSDDLKPYIYKTTNYGATWTKITSGISETAFVRAVREDPKRHGLLYAGTERGVYVSFDDGANWKSFQLNLPTVPVHDLVVKNDDLVLATHGRAFWILDDVSPLRQFAEGIADKDVYLYKPATAFRFHNGGEERAGKLTGSNPPPGAVIYYYVKAESKQEPKPETKIEILDATGNVIRSYSSNRILPEDEALTPDQKKPEKEIKQEAGLNRFAWDLRYQAARRVPGYYLYEYQDGSAGPLALPGQYQVRLTVDGKTQTVPLELKADPRVKIPQADMEKQFHTLLGLRDELNRVYDAVNQIQDVRQQVTGLAKRLPASSKAVADAAGALDAKLVAVRDALVNFKITANEDSLAYPPGIDGSVAFIAMQIAASSDAAPTESQTRQAEKSTSEAEAVLARWSDLQRTDLVGFQKMAAEQGISAVVVPPGGQ